MINFASYSFPKLPGVYFFKDQYEDFLYIGKAKNLERRISSYNTDKQIDWKIESLLKKSTTIEWIITNTEKEALFLEAKLISEFKPLFNKLLTSGNPFTYLIFDSEAKEYPKLFLTRFYKKNDKLTIIGPFLTRKEATTLYEKIIQVFNLYICHKKIDYGCLHYHIGKCSGSCLANFNIKKYKKRFKLALIALLKTEKFDSILENEIKKATKKFDFDYLEELITYRLEYKIIMQIQTDYHNFDEITEQTLSENNLKEELIREGLFELQNKLSLKKIPENIDCIDISHFQGHAVVGAAIRFKDGKYDTEFSHSYKLPFEENNDYQNLTILLDIHYKKNKVPYPDLLLIDGGKGQLSAIKELHLPIPLLALAKKEERLFSEENTEGIILSVTDPMGKLLLSLRNITHNSAIRLHNKLFNTIK